jgi:O-antigen/teichoic acid export membrane protein/glycosyltransferase involved in cell wall biosynthesis
MSARIRVLFVHPFAEEGGSENVLVRLLKELDPRFEPTVLLMEHGPFEERFAELGVPCQVVSLPGKRSVPRFPFAGALTARRLGPEFDVIHANGTKAAMFSSYLARRIDVPMLWMKHGHDFDSWAPRLVGPACDRIACVSGAVAATFPEWLQDRIVVCHPGVPVPPTTTPAAATEPTVMAIGRLDPLKGFDNLIRAVGLLRDRKAQGAITIVGPVNPKSPGHRDELAQLIVDLGLEDRARVLGWVDDIDVLYAKSRVVALASNTPRGKKGVEGAPLVLLEGMSHARPVVAPDDGGIAEIVADAGTLVEAATPDQLADALGPYFADPDYAEEIGSRGRLRVEREFSITKMAQRLEAEYSLLAGRSHLPAAGVSSRDLEQEEEPQQPPPADDGEPGEGEGEAFSQSRRIASNTVARSVGEVVAKLASIAFYIVMARELGSSDFGSFIFGISLSSIVLVGAGFGMDQYLTREVAADRSLVDRLYSNIVTLKGAMIVALLGVLAAIVLIGPYTGETRLAVVLIGIGVGIEMLSFAPQAVVQGYERMHLVAVGLVVQRMVTAIVGIAILLAGGGLIAASLVFLGGSVVGYLVSDVLMRVRVVRPRFALDRSGWIELLKASAPIGASALFFTVLLRLDAALISFLTDGDQAEVGYYGAAYRLVDATMFIGLSVSAAMLPWLARQRRRDAHLVVRGSVLGLKLLTSVLLPIGAAYIVFAPDLIEILYGHDFDEAVLPLRLLGVMTVLYGINWYASSLLIARHRPGAFARGIAVVLVANVIVNLFVIPPYGAAGAAAVAAGSGLALAIYSVSKIWETVGRFTLARAFAGPLLASSLGVAVALLLPLPFWISLFLSGAAYVAVLFAFERTFYADDFNLVEGTLRSFRRGSARGAELPDLP